MSCPFQLPGRCGTVGLRVGPLHVVPLYEADMKPAGSPEKFIRASSDRPRLVRSPVRSREVGQVRVLVVEDEPAELFARVRALTRRVPVQRLTVLCAGDLRLDPASRRVHREQVHIELTGKEFALFLPLPPDPAVLGNIRAEAGTPAS
jgi:hypothetical protein